MIKKNKHITEQEELTLLEYLKLYWQCSFMTKKDVAIVFDVTIDRISSIIKKYDLIKDMSIWSPHKDPKKKKDIEEKTLITNIKKYGVDNPMKAITIKTKSIQNKDLSNIGTKVKQTKLDRYGNSSYNNPLKSKETREEKYGGYFSEESKVKMGVKNNDIDKIKKSRETKLQTGSYKYTEATFNEFFEQWYSLNSRKPAIKDFAEFLGKSQTVSNASKLIQKFSDYNKFIDRKSSYLELLVEEFLQEHSLAYEKHNRQIIKPQELDFYLPDYNIGIEVDDIYTHNSTVGHYGLEPKPLNYHFDKTIKCKQNGVKLLHIYEPQLFTHQFEIWKNHLLHLCGKSEHRVYARDCIVKIVPAIQTKKFFEENNIQGYRNAITTFCLVGKGSPDDILMAYSIGNAWFGKGKYDAEITRGACKLGYNIIGGASKLWKHITEYYKDKNLRGDPGAVNSIVYYIDLNLYQGESMEFLKDITCIKEAQPGVMNYWAETRRLKNREPAKHREIKQLIQEHKILEIGTAGTQVNVWNRF